MCANDDVRVCAAGDTFGRVPREQLANCPLHNDVRAHNEQQQQSWLGWADGPGRKYAVPILAHSGANEGAHSCTHSQ
jgi:hypothetical protein